MAYWKNIIGFPKYEINTEGRVWSWHRLKYLKPEKPKSGYLRVVLCNNGKLKHKFIHRLVLEAFVGLCPKGKECRHLDGNRLNNNLDNLQWGTRSDNAQDAMRHKTHRATNQNGELNTQCKLTKKDVINIVCLWNTKLFRQQEIANMYNISRRNVSHIINRRTWKHIWDK